MISSSEYVSIQLQLEKQPATTFRLHKVPFQLSKCIGSFGKHTMPKSDLFKSYFWNLSLHVWKSKILEHSPCGNMMSRKSEQSQRLKQPCTVFPKTITFQISKQKMTQYVTLQFFSVLYLSNCLQHICCKHFTICPNQPSASSHSPAIILIGIIV